MAAAAITAMFYVILLTIALIGYPIQQFISTLTTPRKTKGMTTPVFTSIMIFSSAMVALLYALGVAYTAAYSPAMAAMLQPIYFFILEFVILVVLGATFIAIAPAPPACPNSGSSTLTNLGINAPQYALWLGGILALGQIQNLAPIFSLILEAARPGLGSFGEPMNLALWGMFGSALASIYGQSLTQRCP